jgi:transposase
MRAYSTDLRERVLADCDRGLGTSAVAAKFSASPAWVRRLKQRRASPPPPPRRPGPKPLLEEGADAQRLREAVKAEPDLSAEEYRQRLNLGCSAVTVWRTLRRMGLTFKKKSGWRRNGDARTWPPGGTTGAAG